MHSPESLESVDSSLKQGQWKDFRSDLASQRQPSAEKISTYFLQCVGSNSHKTDTSGRLSNLQRLGLHSTSSLLLLQCSHVYMCTRTYLSPNYKQQL